MATARGWLSIHLLKLSIVAIALIAAIGGTALAAGPLGSAAKKKKCNQTCQETNLFNSLYDSKIAKAHVAFAAAATNAKSRAAPPRQGRSPARSTAVRSREL